MNTNLPIYVSIVEDNRFIRDGWETILKSVPDFIIEGVFGSCEEAFHSTAIEGSDVVLMDIGLPGMTGIEGTHYIREHWQSTAVIICTVHDDDNHIFDALCAGAVGYLIKRSEPEEIIKAIRDVRNGGSPMSPSIARKVIARFQQPSKTSEQNVTLSERETEILQLMAKGKSYKAIANELFITLDGVNYHIRHIYEKLQVHSRGEAVALGLKAKLISAHH